MHPAGSDENRLFGALVLISGTRETTSYLARTRRSGPGRRTRAEPAPPSGQIPPPGPPRAPPRAGRVLSCSVAKRWLFLRPQRVLFKDEGRPSLGPSEVPKGFHHSKRSLWGWNGNLSVSGDTGRFLEQIWAFPNVYRTSV